MLKKGGWIAIQHTHRSGLIYLKSDRHRTHFHNGHSKQAFTVRIRQWRQHKVQAEVIFNLTQ